MYRQRYCKRRRRVTEGQRFTDTVTNSNENAELPAVSYMEDNCDDCFDVPAEEEASEAFIDETEKQKQIVSAAEILLRIRRECSKRFLEEVLHFLHSLVLTSSDYINELPTLRE